ncbi:hypothetical protein [Amycolatopsis japonica]
MPSNKEQHTGEFHEMLRSYDLYDRAVDIVCAFEALFTRQPIISSTVSHFDRFPSIKHVDNQQATPDFSVIFNDGTGLVGEISNIARHQNSVDKLCKQLFRYDSLRKLPGPLKGSPATVSQVDVLCLVPADLINEAGDRILGDSCLDSNHWYKPSKPPTIVQFSRDADKYSFVRGRDARNGSLTHEQLQGFLNKKFNARGVFWSEVKVLRPFINDPTPPLYLATVIWMKILPAILNGESRTETSVDEIDTALRDQFKYTRRSEVRKAIDLLKRGRFIQANKSEDKILVKRGQRGRQEDAARVLAERACVLPELTHRAKAPTKHLTRSKRPENPSQISLFDQAGA